MIDSDWIGKTVNGRYHIEKLLGKGGMAAVYQATDSRLERTVAIKIIHSHLSENDQFVKRFHREAASVAKLQHRNIIQVYDFSQENGTYYIVFEFVPGDNLQGYLQRLNKNNQQMPIEQAITFATSMAAALAYAHENGVVHRDIKPANVLLDNNDRVVLTDFGLAQISGGTRYTMTGAVMGTARYMSPEQIKSIPTDARADIYSLGVTLFEMLSGRAPFEAETAVTTMMMHLNNPPPHIQELRHDIPSWLVLVIEKALAKAPENRYQSAADLFNDLTRRQFNSPPLTAPLRDTPTTTQASAMMAEQTVTATPDSTQVSDSNPAHPTPLAANTMPAGGIYATIQHAPSADATLDSQPPTKTAKPRRKTALIASGVVVALFLFGFVFATQIMPNLNGSQIAADNRSADGRSADNTPPADNGSGLAGAAVNIADTATNTATNTAVAPNTATSTATTTKTATATNTATATHTATPRPTATPMRENPTGAPRTGSGLPYNFEEFGIWVIGDQANGTFLPTTERHRDGNIAGKLSYNFPSTDNDFVVFQQINPISDEPNALQLWVYGDSSAHYLNAWIEDSEGQIWQAPFGQVTHTGWKQMTALLDTTQDWPWASISGPDNGVVDYPIQFIAFVLDDYDDEDSGEGVIYLDGLTTTTVAGVVNAPATAVPTSAPTATRSTTTSATPVPPTSTAPEAGSVGRIIYTSNNRLYTTDPSWTSPQLLGDAISDSCSNPATTADQTYNLSYGFKCGIGGVGAGVCTSPNGQYDVITNAIDEQTTSIVVEPAGSDNGQFIYQGALDRGEGIRWSPTSDSFLFVIGNTVYRAYPNGTYNQIIEMAYQPIFSANGSLILYRKPVGPGVNDVFVVNADGTNTRNVTNQINVDSICAAWTN